MTETTGELSVMQSLIDTIVDYSAEHSERPEQISISNDKYEMLISELKQNIMSVATINGNPLMIIGVKIVRRPQVTQRVKKIGAIK